jgi:hypothetical protein
LSDPNDPKKALRLAARQWLRANDARARQAIPSSGLPAPLIRDLLRANPPRTGSPGRAQAFLFAFSVFYRRP